MKILVPVDGSSYTKRMLAYLAAHDEWLGDKQTYTLVHVTPAVPSRAAVAIDKQLLRNYYRDESEKVFKVIRKFFDKQRIRAEFVARTGNAAEEICELASRGHFDLVIMGSRGHGRLGNLLLGSVAQKVMASCDAPVLIVR